MTALVPAAKFLRHQPLNPTGRPHMDGGAEPRHDDGQEPRPDMIPLFRSGFALGRDR